MTKLGILADKFIEACWLAALILAPAYMNIYTHRMFEPDKACVIRSLALMSIVFYIVKLIESKTASKLLIEPRLGKGGPVPPTTIKGANAKSVPVISESTGLAIEKSPSSFKAFIKNPIFIGFALFAAAYITSVIFSPVRYDSIWGGFDRLEGLYTNAAYWVLFIMAAMNIKTRAQVNRLISAVIFTSIPIVMYAFIQRFRWDPVPWQAMDPSTRVSATMGNPIFVSAYLIITIPLALSRFSHFVERAKLSRSTAFSVIINFLLAVIASILSALIVTYIINLASTPPLSTETFENAVAAITIILVIPVFAIISKFVAAINEKNIFTFVCYGVLVLLQITTVFLSQSRGPIMGMFTGIFGFIVLYAWTNRKRVLLTTILVALAVGILFLALFNLPFIKIVLTKKTASAKDQIASVVRSEEKTTIVWKNSANATIKEENMPQWWHHTFGKLMNVPYVMQLGRILEITPNTSGRTRMVLWQGVWKLINDKDEPYRFFIGYGPESLSTVYYKNYTMELAALEGSNVHADRSHNGYLDLWVMNGLIGLVSFALLLIAIFYIALRTAFRSRPRQLESLAVSAPGAGGPVGQLQPSRTVIDPLNLIIIGLCTAIISHLVEIVVGIPIVSTLTHFWIITGAIYAVYRIKSATAVQEPELSKGILPAQSGRPEPAQNKPKKQTAQKQDLDLNMDKTSQKGFNLFVGYIIITLLIALILFTFAWPESKIITPDVKSDRDTLRDVFLVWVLFGFIVGIFAWTPYLFWTYIGQTVILVVIMVKRYWPDDSTNTDLLIICSWLWMFAGVIIGAVYLKRDQKPAKFGFFSNLLFGLAMLLVVIFIIVRSDLYPLRADGFYKFCFSYDMSAEDLLRKGNRDIATKIRFDCVRYFQNVLRFNPTERAYLNGAGRNYLEVSKLVEQQGVRENKLTEPPTVRALVDMDFDRYLNFSHRDLFLCSFTCIQRAYELDPQNFERIIAMIRVYRYWGEKDKDSSYFDKALELCKEARKASPLNTKVDDEIRELQRLKGLYKR